MAAAVTSVNSLPHLVGFFPEGELIRVRMPHAVWAHPLQDNTIAPEVQGEASHVMIGLCVKNADPTFTLPWSVCSRESQTLEFYIHDFTSSIGTVMTTTPNSMIAIPISV